MAATVWSSMRAACCASNRRRTWASFTHCTRAQSEVVRTRTCFLSATITRWETQSTLRVNTEQLQKHIKQLIVCAHNELLSFLHVFQVVFQQGTTKLSVEKDKTSVVSDVGISFTDPRTQNTFFSTDFENHEFHLPKGVKVLSVKKASTERVCIMIMMSDSCNRKYFMFYVMLQQNLHYYQRTLTHNKKVISHLKKFAN